jgi:DNA-directed RNA polymerase sigma subunit (sigma70/sigma32)
MATEHRNPADGRQMTYDEIGKLLGISRQAVHQIEQRALKKLRIRLVELGIRNSSAETNDDVAAG